MRNTLYWFLGAFLSACAPTTRVVQVSDNVFRISKEGGWGYDLKALKQEVGNQARTFSASAGKDFEIVEEKVTPDERVDIYPADDDIYALTFRLVDRKSSTSKTSEGHAREVSSWEVSCGMGDDFGAA